MAGAGAPSAFVILCILGIAPQCAESDEASTKRLAGPVVKAATEPTMMPNWEELKRIFGQDALRLSSEDRLTNHFHAYVRLAYKTPAGLPAGSVYLLEWNAGRLGILVLSLDGLPYCYMSSHLLVQFDSTSRGRLHIAEMGNPSFEFAAGDRPKVDCLVTYGTNIEKPYALLDLRGVLIQLLQSSTKITGDITKEIDIKTEHALSSVEFNHQGEQHDLPVKTVAILRPNAGSLVIGPIGLGTAPGPHLLGITADDVRKLGVPTKAVPPSEAEHLNIAVPDDFGKSGRERDAASTFMTLFCPPTTRP